jgi:excisionase family DNA binding protein
MDTVSQPLLVRISDVRHFVPIGKTKTYELIADGTLESVKVGGLRLIKMSSLRRLADSVDAVAATRDRVRSR